MGKTTNPRDRVTALLMPIPKRGASGRTVRPSQTEREAANRSVALEARCRLMGLTREQAQNPMAGYAVGILTLAGFLTREQHDAAYGYALTDTTWRALKGMPRAALPAICLTGAPSGRSTRPAADSDDVLREFDKRRETQRQKLMASIGHQGLAWFDAQVLRDEALSSPLATLALANGCKVLSAPKAKEAA